MKHAPDSERRRVCKHCAVEYFVKPSKASTYCSKVCMDTARRTRPLEAKCQGCAGMFAPRNSERRFCSKRCTWIGHGGAAFNAAVARATIEKRADAMRGRGNGKSYRKLGGRHEHRVVAEQKLGRPLQRGEIVHHLDGNHLNNDPSNLAVMTQAEHMREHGLAVRGQPRRKSMEQRGTK